MIFSYFSKHEGAMNCTSLTVKLSIGKKININFVNK
jgi:hypothetical protein